MTAGNAPHSDAIAYFLTWTTYGTWLPGDERGWTRDGKGWQAPDPERESRAREQLKERPCVLSGSQRSLVEATIRQHDDVSLHAAIGYVTECQ